MKTNLDAIKAACFNFGCSKEVANEILAFEKELREELKQLNEEIHSLMTENNVGMQKVRSNKIGKYSKILEVLGNE